MADDRAGHDVSELDKLDKAALLKVCRLSPSNQSHKGRNHCLEVCLYNLLSLDILCLPLSLYIFSTHDRSQVARVVLSEVADCCTWSILSTLLEKTLKSSGYLQALTKKLVKNGLCKSRPQGIFHARVPIIKFEDRDTGPALLCALAACRFPRLRQAYAAPSPP